MTHTYRFFALITCLAALNTACSREPNPQPIAVAQAGTDAWQLGAMAVTANPYATDAAERMLQAGGHAVDAAIAAHLVLGLVEPQSSGIGGGGFMLVYDYESKSLQFHDGREEAPAAAQADMFMIDGHVMDFRKAWQSGIATGTPGAVALYKLAHEQHGKLPWPDLFVPAITLAETGFEVSPRLNQFLKLIAQYSLLDEHAASAEYFYPGGEALAPGTIRNNPAYANTLRRIANEGISAFYTGEIAQGIADAVAWEPNPGSLTVADLAQYQAVTRPVICGPFRSMEICTTTPPSSGGAQIMIAGLYDHLAQRTEPVRAFVDAQRLAYADRDHYFGDPDQINIPFQELLNPGYLKHRADQPPAPSATPRHGNPEAFLGAAQQTQWSADTTQEIAGTTHLSVIDAQGNAVAFTATVEAPFGNGRFVHGFLLNNEMTDFAREVPTDGTVPANAVAPGKRPRSSMSPTMVFDGDDNLLMVTGSPGGNSIPAYVAKTIIGVFDWGLDAQAAADHPNIIARGQKVRVETGVGNGADIAAALKDYGYDVQEREGENSGIHLIVVRDSKLQGAADKRREGTVAFIPPANETQDN